jgi:hypothetical protein
MNQKLKALIKQNQAEAAMLRPKRGGMFAANRFGPLVFLLIFTAAGGAFMYQSGASPLDGTSGNTAELYVTPRKLADAKGSELVASIWANSHSQPVNAVQAVITYPPDKLRYIESDASSSQFTIQVDSQASAGKLVVSRSSAQPLTGNQLVAGVMFERAQAGSSDITIQVDGTSQLLSSNDGQNILKLAQ